MLSIDTETTTTALRSSTHGPDDIYRTINGDTGCRIKRCRESKPSRHDSRAPKRNAPSKRYLTSLAIYVGLSRHAHHRSYMGNDKLNEYRSIRWLVSQVGVKYDNQEDDRKGRYNRIVVNH